MKIWITGGCGFQGSNLPSEALRRGVDFKIYDDLSRRGSNVNLLSLQGLGS